MPAALPTRRRVLPCWRHWGFALLCCAELLLGDGSRAQASEMVFGGQVTAMGRSSQSDISGDSQQLGMAGTVTGAGYIWRPWFATLNVNLTLLQNTTETNADDLTARQRSKDRLLSGQVRLTWFPSSRFPQEDLIDIYDTRVETDNVGIALQDVKTLRRERIGATQHYRPASGDSNYTLQAMRTRTLENDGTRENTNDLLAAAAHRFGANALDYQMSFRDTVRDEPLLRRQNTLTDATVRHTYRPDESLSVESVLDSSHTRELLNEQPSKATNDTSLDNFTTWRSQDKRWTWRTHVGGKRSESTVLDVPAENRSENVSAGFSFEWTRALRVTGEAGGGRVQATDSPDVTRSFENAGLFYTPQAVPLGPFHYRWSSSVNLANANSSDTKAVQTGSLGLRHGLDWVSSSDDTLTLTASLNQGFTATEDSRDTQLFTLNHLASTAALWRGDHTTSLLQLNASDARTHGRQTFIGGTTPVQQTLQTADAHANETIDVSRATTLEGDLRVGVTRQTDNHLLTRTRFSSASASYTYAHVFGVDRLRFRSRLEYSLRLSVTDAVSEEKEERASFDNKLDYVIGLLTLGLRRTITRYDGHRNVVTVVSATRVF